MITTYVYRFRIGLAERVEEVLHDLSVACGMFGGKFKAEKEIEFGGETFLLTLEIETILIDQVFVGGYRFQGLLLAQGGTLISQP
ncbi:MAG: hypothetical protein UW68_C0039G0012 [Candidatus Collierbacteria bacterium GW2011_GWB1_44_6]|uniref:Uncharacterized protein n=1 Tax=Candidatus Collierbacteria bacterium GW2011_GWB1_44_6 TaxID=1618384 RepID=A0A0G1MK42_9BACT|nr:MAG: hypothetical protein UW68_C0039G0012 [Candidatus Collierbacteria bacterium GW2011_GWB1_44_6]